MDLENSIEYPLCLLSDFSIIESWTKLLPLVFSLFHYSRSILIFLILFDIDNLGTSVLVVNGLSGIFNKDCIISLWYCYSEKSLQHLLIISIFFAQ